MSILKKSLVRPPLLIASTVGAISLTIATIVFAVQPKVGLGSTSNYAVLAGAGISNTGPTTVSGSAGGDMGSSPTGDFTGDTSVTTTGTKYTAVDSKTTAAKDDLVLAYNDAAGRTPVTTVSADLGGQTLISGVYNSGSSLGLTGTLTLDGENNPDAVFIFQAGSTLTTASSSKVALINGAQACNVFWQVGSSATFGTNSEFVGHVFALTSISANTGATFYGQLLARNGAVTLDSNTIVNDLCDATATPTATATATATAEPDSSSGGSNSGSADDSTTTVASASPESKTVKGGRLPNTDIPLWLFIPLVGIILVGIGSYSLVKRRNRR